MRFVRIIGHVEAVTADALLVKVGRDDKEWFPRKAVRSGEVVEKGDIHLEVSEPWLKDHRLEWWIAK